MPHDFQVEGGESFGEWLRTQMTEAMVFEEAPWASTGFDVSRIASRPAGRPKRD
jgi:hypothetical protein